MSNMKVVCIHKDNWSGGLTIGKTYEVTSYERLPNEYFLRLDDVFKHFIGNLNIYYQIISKISIYDFKSLIYTL